MSQQKEEENLKMGENNVYKAVEKYLDECLLDEMSQNMAKSDQEYHLKINVYMLKRVIQIILSEMKKDNERKSDVASEGGKMTCDLCGTKVKVVGDETMHYQPVVDREMIYKILEDNRLDVTDDYGEASEKLADVIISAMYGTVDNVVKEEK